MTRVPVRVIIKFITAFSFKNSGGSYSRRADAALSPAHLAKALFSAPESFIFCTPEMSKGQNIGTR